MLPRSLIIISLLAIAAATPAQDRSTAHPMTAAEVLKQANTGASDVEQLRTALRSPDATTRVNTMHAMLESNNPVLTSIAISEGNASSDVVLRNLAVRAAFREVLAITPQPVNQLSDQAAQVYARMVRTPTELKLDITAYEWATGRFKAGNNGVGEISYSRLEFQMPVCSGVLAAKEGTWIYEGRVNCLYGNDKLNEVMRVQIR